MPFSISLKKYTDYKTKIAKSKGKIPCFNCNKGFNPKEMIIYIDPQGHIVYLCNNCYNQLKRKKLL